MTADLLDLFDLFDVADGVVELESVDTPGPLGWFIGGVGLGAELMILIDYLVR